MPFWFSSHPHLKPFVRLSCSGRPSTRFMKQNESAFIPKDKCFVRCHSDHLQPADDASTIDLSSSLFSFAIFHVDEKICRHNSRDAFALLWKCNGRLAAAVDIDSHHLLLIHSSTALTNSLSLVISLTLANFHFEDPLLF